MSQHVNKLNKPILILAKELQEALRSPRTVVIDCRFDLGDPTAGRRAYEQGHVPGAVFLDLDEDLAGPVTPVTGRHPLPDPHELSCTLGRLGISRAHEIVVYDGSHGGIAALGCLVPVGHHTGLLPADFASVQPGQDVARFDDIARLDQRLLERALERCRHESPRDRLDSAVGADFVR